MKVAYLNRGEQVRYRCVWSQQQTGAPVCQSFGGLRLERAVERLVLDAWHRSAWKRWSKRPRAMRGPARRNGRTGGSVWSEPATRWISLAGSMMPWTPANRLVARELERRFETGLRELKGIEPQAQARIEALEKPLTSEEQETLRSYAGDLTRLWHAPTTRSQDRKRIIRCLIEHVVVTVAKGESNVKAEVHWTVGEMTSIEVLRGQSGIHRYVTNPELIGMVRELATGFSDEQIARILHRKRLRTGTGRPFTAQRVTILRYTYGIRGTASRKLEGDHVYTAEQAAELLGVSRGTLIRWIEAGLLRGSQMTAGAPWRVEVTEQDRRRLTAADVPEGRLSLKAAAGALAVSQQTVLQRLKSGKIEAQMSCTFMASSEGMPVRRLQ